MNNDVNNDGSKKLTDKEQDQKVKNMEKEAKGHKYLGEGHDGVKPLEKGEQSATLNKAKVADQAGETKMASSGDDVNEIEPPRHGEPTINTIDGKDVGVKHVWDMNFSNADSNVEGLGHAFAAVGVDFTAAGEQDDEENQIYFYVLKPADAKDNAKGIEGKLDRNITPDAAYAVFLDYCLSKKPIFIGNFGAHATVQE